MILNGVSNIPPATGINYSSWFAVGFVFQYWIRKKNFAWWSKFNYVASSALDSGEFYVCVLCVYCVCDGVFFVRYCPVVDCYIFDVASAKRGDQFEMVGEYGSYEKYAVLSLSDLFCRLLIWFGFFFLAADWNRTPWKSIPEGGIPS